MPDRYGYIGIETLLNFCENSKDHAITPNDIMRLKRVGAEQIAFLEFLYNVINPNDMEQYLQMWKAPSIPTNHGGAT